MSVERWAPHTGRKISATLFETIGGERSFAADLLIGRDARGNDCAKIRAAKDERTDPRTRLFTPGAAKVTGQRPRHLARAAENVCKRCMRRTPKIPRVEAKERT
jgi:hypothetical protein